MRELIGLGDLPGFNLDLLIGLSVGAFAGVLASCLLIGSLLTVHKRSGDPPTPNH